jgi:hypothetical protein
MYQNIPNYPENDDYFMVKKMLRNKELIRSYGRTEQ